MIIPERVAWNYRHFGEQGGLANVEQIMASSDPERNLNELRDEAEF